MHLSPTEILKQYFGYDSFRGGQLQAVDALLQGQDVLCVMPTGAGKSVCYQVPAMALPGITLVISPLISLMKDQVASLTRAGIPAAYLNSALTDSQFRLALSRMAGGAYKIVYVAPERLSLDSFRDLCARLDISLIAVDEAHCISQWGQDFRPDYLKIVDFIHTLPTRPTVGAFTATATPEVAADITARLELFSPQTVRTGFDRPNLFFSVLQPGSKTDELLAYLSQNRGKSGIVYCATRKTVEQVHEALIRAGFPATRYHAGLSQEERKQNQEDFSFDVKPIIVATNAFGMGIDKSSVSFVVHYNMPKSMEAYYQEAGRAGRDGSPAECILFYSRQDIMTNKRLIDLPSENDELTEEEQEEVRKADHARLQKMIDYAETTGCLRAQILRYFGDPAPADNCGRCSSCLGLYEAVDITIEAQKILSCVAKTGQRYGMSLIAEVLKGSHSEKINRFRLSGQSTYGLLSDRTLPEIRDIISALLQQDYLAADEGDYPILRLTPRSREALSGNIPVSMKRINRKKDRKRKKDANIAPLRPDQDLYELLAEKRTELARQENVPAYIIFSNATLQHMSVLRPTIPEAFLDVPGVGKAKQEKYGPIFIPLIRDYCETHPVEQDPVI